MKKNSPGGDQSVKMPSHEARTMKPHRPKGEVSEEMRKARSDKMKERQRKTGQGTKLANAMMAKTRRAKAKRT